MTDVAAQLKKTFAEFDKDKSATISRQRLQAVLKKLDPTLDAETLDNIFALVDKNGNGVIEYNEFIDFIYDLEGDKPKTPRDFAEQQQILADAELPQGTTLSRGKTKLLDISHWKKAVSGGGTWAFQCDADASAIRNIVKTFPDLSPTSPEGLTLAEEFILVWQDEKTGELAEYSYFGTDEPFHNALFGACLLGLRARGLLEFAERKCRYMGTWYKLMLSGEPPSDSEVLQAVYKELKSEPDNSLKLWFEQKSGKWGQDSTSQLVLKALVDRGILEAGEMGDQGAATTFKFKNKAVRTEIVERLRKVISGEVEADMRSVALLALCRTADMRDASSNTLMESIFGKANVAGKVQAVDKLVSQIVRFNGIGAEEINKMIDMCPIEWQQYLESEKFSKEATATFKDIDKSGNGTLDPDELTDALHKCMSKEISTKLGVNAEGMKTVILMFDANQDGKLQEDEFVGFLMWCKAMEALS